MSEDGSKTASGGPPGGPLGGPLCGPPAGTGGAARDGPAEVPPNGPRFGEGACWAEDSPEALAAVVDGAFDYRGDVTLLLDGGETLVGYVANRHPSGPDPHLVLFPSDGGAPRKVSYRSVRGVHFTGKDTASGKSWEAWVQRYEARRKARSDGEAVGELGLFPDPLE